jgi:CheY-like chemotaxis protein
MKVIDAGQRILVLEDIEETRDGIEKLLQADGYRVEAVRNERDAVECAGRNHPDLILISLGGSPREIVATARQIRVQAELGEQIPVVVFCIGEVGEGDELAIGQNIYLTRPDNFNQLRTLLARLLDQEQTSLAASIT